LRPLYGHELHSVQAGCHTPSPFLLAQNQRNTWICLLNARKSLA
jgi:hypothetical protein